MILQSHRLRQVVRSIDRRLRQFYGRHPLLVSFAVPLVPVVLTLVVAIFDPPTFAEGFRRGIGWPVDLDATWRVAFIIVMAALFILTQYMRLRGQVDERVEERDQQDKLIRALAVLPRVEFMFELSPETYDSIDDLLCVYNDRLYARDFANWSADHASEKLNIVARELRSVLWSLASLAENYGITRSYGQTDPRYGTSLMLYVQKNDFTTLDSAYTTPVGEDGGGCLRFVEDDFSLQQLRGLLVLDDQLLLTDSDDPKAKPNASTQSKYPRLSLPVRDVANEYQLFGGPQAIDRVSAEWILDVRNRLKGRSPFGAHVHQQLEIYFAEGGDGEAIRGLLSMAVGTKEDPLAVVNFDADIVNFLGDRDDHYAVFVSLIRPALVLMRPAVKYYRALKGHVANAHEQP